MEKLLPVYAQLGFESIRKKQAMEDTEDAVREYVDTYMGGEENKSSRFAYLLTRLTATCGSLLWQVVLEMRQSRFVPVDYELPIGLPDEEHPEAVEPLRLTLPDGTQVYVQGKVDRVDILKKGDDAYVRVVDYKTGSKEFRLAEVMDGINVQMLIYLMSIWANGGQRYGSSDARRGAVSPRQAPGGEGGPGGGRGNGGAGPGKGDADERPAAG